MKSYKFIFTLFFLGSLTLGFGQSNTKLNRLKANQRKIQREIKLISSTLVQMKKEKQSSLAKLSTINQLVLFKERLLINIEQELGYLSKETSALEDIINAMSSDLDSLRVEYGNMIYQASKVHHTNSKLTLLFTSSSYQDFKTKIKLLSLYTEARRKQVRKIDAMKIILEEKSALLQKKVKVKKTAKTQLLSEKEEVTVLKKEQISLVDDLKGKEDDVKKRLSKKEKEKRRVEKLIKDIIRKEIDRQNKKQDPKTHAKDAIKSKLFEQNRGLLPWPIIKCFVVGRYGKVPHPHLRGVTIDNYGVKLQTPLPSAPVRAVFGGKVSTVATIPGVGKIVMIKHGMYYTVYSGLTGVIVKSGQIVATKQNIGKVKKNIEGNYVLDFQIWKGRTRINPRPWLYK